MALDITQRKQYGSFGTPNGHGLNTNDSPIGFHNILYDDTTSVTPLAGTTPTPASIGVDTDVGYKNLDSEHETLDHKYEQKESKHGLQGEGHTHGSHLVVGYSKAPSIAVSVEDTPLGDSSGEMYKEIGDTETLPLLEPLGQKRQRGLSSSSQASSKSKKYNSLCRKLRSKQTKEIFNAIKVGFLFIVMVTCTIVFAAQGDRDIHPHQISVSLLDHPDDINITGASHNYPIVQLYMTASFLLKPPNKDTKNVTFRVINPLTGTTKEVVRVIVDQEDLAATPEDIEVERLDFSEDEEIGDHMIIQVRSTAIYSVPVVIGYVCLSTMVYNEVIYAAIILVAVYILIIFDLIHRSLAAMVGATATLAVLAALNLKPSLDEVLEWLDYDTLCLLFGMMTMVAIFCDTGFFDWVALMSYKVAKGKTWPLITILCITAAVVSAFLDNVTTILLLTPVTIRLCEVMRLDPKHVLIAEVMFSNIGGTATAIGDPPNVIIVSSKDLDNASNGAINFSTFTLHMMVGCIFITIITYGLLRIMYRKKELLRSSDPPDVYELVVEMDIWKRSANKIMVASREEEVVKELLVAKIQELEELIATKREMHKHKKTSDFTVKLEELESKYKIQDKVLLIKSGFVIGVVIIGFFVHSFLANINLTVGWIAILGAIWLLVLSDYSDIDSILHRIEWATLLFFASLFALMKGLEELGLIDFLADQSTSLIKSIDEGSRLPVAIIVIIWISALASSFIDNIPFTTAMLPIVIQLSEDESLGLPLDSLVWALAFGACLGGNGTLIGASANVVCAGLAENHGHPFSFVEFFKVGFPTMLVSVTVAMCYLLICHVAFDWTVLT